MLTTQKTYTCFVTLKLIYEQLKRQEKVIIAENLSAKQLGEFTEDDKLTVENTKRRFKTMYDNHPELFLEDLRGRGIIDNNGLVLKRSRAITAKQIEVIIEVGKEMFMSQNSVEV
jgi:hypothetical protein